MLDLLTTSFLPAFLANLLGTSGRERSPTRSIATDRHNLEAGLLEDSPNVQRKLTPSDTRASVGGL